MNRKLVVVTGGTKGIGKAILKGFAQLGEFDLVTCARNLDDLNNLKTEFSSEFPNLEVFFKQTDVSIKRDCTSFIEFIQSIDREVEVLVNNAGVFIPGAVHEEEEGSLDLMIKTNLYSAYDITRGLISQMKNNKSGYIFNICSTASIIPYVNGGSYCISKFALYGMTKVLREEMKEHGIRVSAILPGATLTASWDGVDLPPERFMKPEDVASAVINAYQMSPNSIVEEILIRPQLGDI